MTVLPLEAPYNGTMYRSRTEARWAIMFDAAGIEFQYEPDGFDLRGEWYVPDFWVPAWNSYVEVKQDGFPLLTGWWPRERCAAELLNEESGKDVYLSPGSPSPDRWMYRWQSDKVSSDRVYLATLVPASCIVKAKKHRFDWDIRPRERPRPVFTGEGAIGLLATDILKKVRKE